MKIGCPWARRITDPVVLRAELAVVRTHWNGYALHAGIGYVTPLDEHEGTWPSHPQGPRGRLEASRLRRLAYHRTKHQQQPDPGPDDVV